MNKIAFSLILSLPLLFASCKKDTDNPGTNDDQKLKGNIVFLNISDSTPYRVVSSAGIPNNAVLLPPGGTVKEYTLDEVRDFTLLFARVNIDSVSITMPLKGNTESVFIMYDGTDVYCNGSTTTCYSPQKGKAIVRYINVSGFQKMEAKDENDSVTATYNAMELSPRFGVDTIPRTSATFCTQLDAGKYSFDVYSDGSPTSPAYTKADVSIQSDKVYFVFLNGKKEVKVIER